MASSQGKAGQAARAAALQKKKVSPSSSIVSTTKVTAPMSASRLAIQNKAGGIKPTTPVASQSNSLFRGDLGKPTGLQQTQGFLGNSGASEFDKTKIQAGDVSGYKFGKDAYGLGNEYLDNRDEQVAKNIIAQGGDVGEYLKGQSGFSSATGEEQQRTIDAITKRIGAFDQPKEEVVVPEVKRDLPGELDTAEQIRLTTETEKSKSDALELEKNRKQREQLDNESANITSSERIAQASKQIDNLIQNTAYLGTRGQPGVSSVQLAAVKDQVGMAQQTFNRIKQVEANAQASRGLSTKYNAEVFEQQMEGLQSQLDQQVGTATQSAINALQAEGESIDSMEEFYQIKGAINFDLDKAIANIAISNHAQRAKILATYNAGIADEEARAKGKAIVDEVRSKANNVYVDGNGDAMVDFQGNHIPYNPKLTTIYDAKKGKLVSYDPLDPGAGLKITNVFGGSVGGNGNGVGNGVAGAPGVAPTQFSSSYNPSMISTYNMAVESGKMPTQSQIASLGGFETFMSDANKAYIDNQNNILKAQGMKLIDPAFYASMTPDERKAFKTDSTTVRQVVSKLDSIVDKINESGLPRQKRVGKGAELKGKITDLQLALKGEGAYALGVLTGPDMGLLESVIPTPDLIQKAGGAQQFIDRLNEARSMFIQQINTQNAGKGVEFTPSAAKKYTGTDGKKNTSSTGGTQPTNFSGYNPR